MPMALLLPSLRGSALAALAGWLLLTPGAGAQGVEPLVLRVQDVVGVAGGPASVVVRTYASRPVRRGKFRVCDGGVAEVTCAGFAALGPSPIAAWTGGYVFDASGAVVATLTPGPGGAIDADFCSPEFSINRDDGVVMVLFANLDPSATPGSEFVLGGDAAASNLFDPEDDPIAMQFRDGRLRFRAPGAPLEFDVSDTPVQAGSGAVVEIGTSEAFAIGSGVIVLHFDPAVLAPGTSPRVEAQSHHGAVDLVADVSMPGTISITFDSTPGAGEVFLNEEVPGDLFRITIPTHAGVPDGLRALTFDLGATHLEAPGGAPLPVLFENGNLEFGPNPDIFRDGFEIGDTGWWSATEDGLPPPPPVTCPPT